MNQASHFDAPFWGALIVGIFAVSMLGAFGFAAAAQDAPRGDARILTSDDWAN